MTAQTPRERLEAHLALSDDLCAAVQQFVETSAAKLRSRGYSMALRDKVIMALALKIDSAFRALIDDARKQRSEATHHLKTMVEAFIYMFVAGKDLTDKTAQRILAELYEKKAGYFKNNQDRDPGTLGADWTKALGDLKAEGITPIGNVGASAASHSPELRGWYDAVYRSACETAHISDLFDFMPDTALTEIPIAAPRTGPLQAQIAIDHGLQVMLHTMRFVNDNDQRMVMDLEPFETRLADLRLRREAS